MTADLASSIERIMRTASGALWHDAHIHAWQWHQVGYATKTYYAHTKANEAPEAVLVYIPTRTGPGAPDVTDAARLAAVYVTAATGCCIPLGMHIEPAACFIDAGSVVMVKLPCCNCVLQLCYDSCVTTAVLRQLCYNSCVTTVCCSCAAV
jgi:hypothetical protein